MVGGQPSKITDHKLGYKKNGNIQRVFFIARLCAMQELMLLPGDQ